MIGLYLIMFSNIKKLFYKLILILSILLTSKVSFSSETNLIKSLSNTGNHKIFIRILESSPLFLSLVNNTVSSTIYAPTDKAFSLMPDSFMREINNNNIKYTTKIILTHIFSGNSLETNKNEGLVLSLDGSLYYTMIQRSICKRYSSSGQSYLGWKFYYNTSRLCYVFTTI
ncbi:MAG: hypothetical protein CM15mP124_6110 [Alphaproteobacteria bacterium]|nr:MAG: hypothetical protein CM15mP124_6110 [Alphaproteobacteria bacterium]